MLFNTLDFAIFLPIVFLLYWFVTAKHLKIQNLLIFIASYIFYGWWDWKFLGLIAFSTVVDYFIAIYLQKTKRKKNRKLLLYTSILINIGFLGVFKYFNFFIDNFESAFSFFGYQFQGYSLNIILPVGISFYTFQTLSYTIDVYHGKLKPTKDFIAFGAFVSFFPQLVAGPIERAKHLLPQFFEKRKFDYELAKNGLRQILWGLFKKMVIADNCAEYVNIAFSSYDTQPASVLAFGAILFAFQIYGDFSGYSDIAIGTARLFGFNLKQNFAYPYFSRDIAEFWRRWHISLSTWFRDYVYIPLGGSQVSKILQIRNVFIVFLVSGFWHGANWTFIIWGALNALYFLPLLLLKRNRVNTNTVAEDKILPTLKEAIGILNTFIITTLGWIFFRAETIHQAIDYIKLLFSKSLFILPTLNTSTSTFTLLLLILFLLVIEWIGRTQKFALSNFSNTYPVYLRWVFYSMIIFFLGMYMNTNETPFIYFQF